jgi:hypothetical protein
MIWQCGYIKYIANDGLIRFNKSISWITKNFCNLFIITIWTLHVTFPYNSWCEPHIYLLLSDQILSGLECRGGFSKKDMDVHMHIPDNFWKKTS